jgi:hypothetical protein
LFLSRAKLDSDNQLAGWRTLTYACGMEKPKPAIVTGLVRLQQDAPDADIKITHRSEAGETTIKVPAERLRRWALRLLRDEVFA